MSDVYSLMKYLTPYELDHIKFLAHNEEIPYQIINTQYNIDKNETNFNLISSKEVLVWLERINLKINKVASLLDES